jgi:hypothetical protein
MTNTDKLWAMLDGLGLPSDDDHDTFFRPLQITKRREGLEAIIDDFVVRASTKNRRGKQLENYRLHWQYMLLNLCSVAFQRQWLVVSLHKNAYATDMWLKFYGLSYAYMAEMVSFLESYGLVEVKKGKKYEVKPKRTRLFPSPKLTDILKDYLGFIEQEIKPPYVCINKGESRWGGAIARLSEDHPDIVDMTIINEFLMGHQWACKAPVRLVYKNNAFMGGRLSTPFQNLPDRNVRIRINTLIDGQPICEIDFNANHLRLNLAFNAKEDAGDTPYEDIGEIAKVTDRDKIKRFITVSMGAANEAEARPVLYQDRINNDLFDRVHQATLQRFPKLQLFTGWGIFAQNYEGQILKDVMLQGVAKGIVCLPVHDAVAAQQRHEEWAKEVMLETWSKHMGGVKTRVKVDKAIT